MQGFEIRTRTRTRTEIVDDLRRQRVKSVLMEHITLHISARDLFWSLLPTTDLSGNLWFVGEWNFVDRLQTELMKRKRNLSRKEVQDFVWSLRVELSERKRESGLFCPTVTFTPGSSLNKLVEKCLDEIVDMRRYSDPPKQQQVGEISVVELMEWCSVLSPDLLEKVGAHLPPRQLYTFREFLNRWMLIQHFIKAKKIRGFLVSTMCKRGGGWRNVDLYFDKNCNLVQLMEHDGYIKMLGTANGIVLFEKDQNLVVLNPITQKRRNLPPPIFEFDPDNHELYHFHYLESDKEYFILRIVQSREESWRTDIEMYSSSTDSWKVIEPPVPCMRGGEEISFEVKSGSSLPLYHVGYPVKMDDRVYYVAADPQHSYYVALLAFDMKDHAFHIVKIFPRKVYPTSYDVQLGVYRDRVLALLITNVDTGEQLLTTLDNESSVQSTCTGVSLLPKLLVERLEEIGAVVKKVFPFTDSLHAVTLKIPY